jgi:formate dehydrogenase subunit beta
MKAFVTVQDNDTLGAVSNVLRKLLESDQMDGLLVPMRTSAGTVTPALVTDPAMLDQADPLAPVLPINSARVLGWMTQREPRGKIGAVMRSCEIRAMVELVKLKQACLDCITLISIDCSGTFDVPDYIEQSSQLGQDGITKLVQDRYTDPLSAAPIPLRDACQMCERPVHTEADVVFEFFGSDVAQGFMLTLPDELAGKIGLAESTPAGNGNRADVIDTLIASRTEQRDKVFDEINARMKDGKPGEGLEEIFGACIRCHNCMTVCPICYCKTCLFKGPVFDHEPIQYMQWAERKGALRLPSDTMLFHLTRMNHMGLSCVGCGMCTSVCPSDIPVGRVFRAVGNSVQSVFDYVPGFNPEEMLPLIAFQEDEWHEVGE